MLPEEAVAWYAGHGYQFLGLSEHNALSNREFWIAASDVMQRAGDDVRERCDKQFGALCFVSRVRDGIEEWRLKTIQELRQQFEKPGRFLLLSNEEVTNEVTGLPVHLTAVNISRQIEPECDGIAASAIEDTLARIEAESRSQAGPAIGVINHPNFAWAITADIPAQVKQAQFVEIFNGHPFTASRGDIGKRSAVRLWDMSNAERLVERGWPPLYGVGSDDAHVKEGASEPSPGRGWIVVRATSLSAADLIAAMKRGEFYASTGVRLKHLDYDPKNRVISLTIDPDPNTTYKIEFFSTKVTACPLESAAPTERWDAPSVGVVVAHASTLESRYRLVDDDAFVRATVTGSRAPDNPIESVYEGDKSQFQQAFTQPVGWERYLSRRRPELSDVSKRCSVARKAE